MREREREREGFKRDRFTNREKEITEREWVW